MHKAAQSLEASHRAMPYKVTNRHVSLAEGRRVLLKAATPAYAPTMQHIEFHDVSIFLPQSYWMSGSFVLDERLICTGWAA